MRDKPNQRKKIRAAIQTVVNEPRKNTWQEVIARWRDLVRQNDILRAELAQTQAKVDMSHRAFDEEMAKPRGVRYVGGPAPHGTL